MASKQMAMYRKERILQSRVCVHTFNWKVAREGISAKRILESSIFSRVLGCRGCLLVTGNAKVAQCRQSGTKSLCHPLFVFRGNGTVKSGGSQVAIQTETAQSSLQQATGSNLEKQGLGQRPSCRWKLEHARRKLQST